MWAWTLFNPRAMGHGVAIVGTMKGARYRYFSTVPFWVDVY